MSSWIFKVARVLIPFDWDLFLLFYTRSKEFSTENIVASDGIKDAFFSVSNLQQGHDASFREPKEYDEDTKESFMD